MGTLDALDASRVLIPTTGGCHRQAHVGGEDVQGEALDVAVVRLAGDGDDADRLAVGTELGADGRDAPPVSRRLVGEPEPGRRQQVVGGPIAGRRRAVGGARKKPVVAAVAAAQRDHRGGRAGQPKDAVRGLAGDLSRSLGAAQLPRCGMESVEDVP